MQQNFLFNRDTALANDSLVGKPETAAAETHEEVQHIRESQRQQEIQALLAELRQAIEQRKQNYDLASKACFMMCLAAFLMSIAMLGFDIPRLGFWDPFSLWLLILAIYYFCCLGRGAKRLRAAIAAIAQTDDIRAVGLLAEALLVPTDFDLYTAPIPALKRLLPRLQETDGNLLDDRQRKCLYRTLFTRMQRRGQRRYDPEFACAVLDMISKFGDGTAYASVKALANRAAETPQEMQVWETAQRCLERLDLLRQQEKSAQTLLRASSAPSILPDILLRPAQATVEINPGTLLRPAASDE